MPRIFLYLMNEKGLYTLWSIINYFGSSVIEGCVVAKDKNVINDYYIEITQLCEANNIPFYDKNHNLDNFSGYILAIGWRWIIPNSSNLIVLHDSLLPKYRGFSPLVNMLINGEKEIGVTAIFANENFDQGDIIDYEKHAINYPIKIFEAIEIIKNLYGVITIKVLKKVFKNSVEVISQNENEATYSVWRDYKDYFIDWRMSSTKIKRIVDALSYPYLGARTLLNGEQIILLEVSSLDYHFELNHPGKIIFIDDGAPVVICGEGAIKIIEATNLNYESILPFKKLRVRFGE